LETIVKNMAKDGLKCLSYAYRLMKRSELEELMKLDPESEGFLE